MEHLLIYPHNDILIPNINAIESKKERATALQFYQRYLYLIDKIAEAFYSNNNLILTYETSILIGGSRFRNWNIILSNMIERKRFKHTYIYTLQQQHQFKMPFLEPLRDRLITRKVYKNQAPINVKINWEGVVNAYKKAFELNTIDSDFTDKSDIYYWITFINQCSKNNNLSDDQVHLFYQWTIFLRDCYRGRTSTFNFSELSECIEIISETNEKKELII